MIGFIVLGVIVTVLLLALVANSRWAANKGWVFNKHNPRPSGHGIPMMLDEIYNPSVEHTIEEQASESVRADQKESGDKPNVD
ncbi:MAG: hypothetical protein BMS9Abin17_0419 [Acidimicrobiia bacterium]|nr:MAG: hypothetical protein BMS9Abin17_0419 [Acidimicrobiia bacterium]